MLLGPSPNRWRATRSARLAMPPQWPIQGLIRHFRHENRRPDPREARRHGRDRGGVSAQRHLAQLNIGRLVAPPRTTRAWLSSWARSTASTGSASGPPASSGWMEGSGEPGTGNTEKQYRRRSATSSPISPCGKAFADLEHFVWNTVHRQFLERRANWFEALGRAAFRDVVDRAGASSDAGRRRWSGWRHLKVKRGRASMAFDWEHARGLLTGFLLDR